ncbi:MAG: DUF4153 domain-containing protein [Cognatishimia sp.]|uniref:DUF4153 domain-containing protein n=1 Tax=Cognatishimia sp. TaxID=2211648 RepID=UPI003B8DEE0A
MTELEQDKNLNQQHLWMSILGALAGLSMWVLFEYLPDAIENDRLLLWSASATVGFFVLSFALLGSLRWQRALIAAALAAAADASLLFWASERFSNLDQMIDHSYVILAWGVILFIGAPFIVAALLRRIRDYTLLFDTSWNIVVRYIAAWIFVGIFWGLLMLSNELLGIVGISVIEDLLDFDPVPYVLSGTALGIALSVAQDLKAYVSPYLPLRLFRLLLPMVLVVVAIFIAALPLRGLSGLFGSFSAAATLMSVAISAIFLVSSALDRVDEDGVQSKFMRLVTRGMALLLPVLAGLAIWAIWLRVSEYGWTPERIAASLAALMVFAYAVLYGLAVLQKRAWRVMIRQANIAMAVMVLFLAALWMTPLMNAQKISVEAQLARYTSGISNVENIPAWALTHEWGIAGKEAIQRLQELDENRHADLHARLDRAKELSRWEFNKNDDSLTVKELAGTVQEHLQVWPEGYSVPDGFFSDLGRYRLERWTEACARDIERPCVMIVGPFGFQGVENVIFISPQIQDGATIFSMDIVEGALQNITTLQVSIAENALSDNAYRQILSGGYRIGPAQRQSLWIGEQEIDSEN